MFASAYMGRKRRAQPIPTRLLHAKEGRKPRARILVYRVKAFEKAIFGPCTLGRTLRGTRPGAAGFVLCSNRSTKSANFDSSEFPLALRDSILCRPQFELIE